MAQPSQPQPAHDSPGATQEAVDQDAAADQDAITDPDSVTDEVGPDMSDADRFFVNGRVMPFETWVEDVMSPIAPREPAAAEPPPEPEAREIVWLSRRPVE